MFSCVFTGLFSSSSESSKSKSIFLTRLFGWKGLEEAVVPSLLETFMQSSSSSVVSHMSKFNFLMGSAGKEAVRHYGLPPASLKLLSDMEGIESRDREVRFLTTFRFDMLASCLAKLLMSTSRHALSCLVL